MTNSIDASEPCSDAAREFSGRLSRIEDVKLRAELRNRFEEICEQAGGYVGVSYNHRAERRAYATLCPSLNSRGF